MQHLNCRGSQRWSPRLVCLFSLAAAFLLATGCGKGTKEKITGTVMLGDSPVGGTLVFKGDSKEYDAPINNKGEYVIANIPKGNYKVYIKPSALIVAPGPAPGGGLPKLPGEENNKPSVAAPKQYTDPTTSGLSFDYTGGTQEYPIVLKAGQ